MLKAHLIRPLLRKGDLLPQREKAARVAFATVTLCAFGTPAAAAGDLYIFNWTDYTAPALIKKFETETGIKVTVDTYDTNETLLAKMTSGSAGYDIVVMSSDFVPIFTSQGLVQPIDGPSLKGYGNIEARWRGPAWDPGNRYTVPFHWGVTAFAYNTKTITTPVDSLKTLFEPPPEVRGKVGMFSAPTEVVSLAELELGLPPCQTDLAAMKKVDALLQAQRPSVRVYDSQGIAERLASGDAVMHEITNGDAARTRALNPDIRFVFPKEGAVGWMDNLAIPKGATHPDNAKLFLDFMLRPENAALSANFTHFATAISGSDAYFDPAIRAATELKVPADTKIVFSPTCSADAIKLIDKVWTRLRK